MVDRVAVFIDYQNCYMRARSAFFGGSSRSHIDGQVFPRRLAVKLRDAAVGDRQLVAVRVYRGMPSSTRDPKGYGAADRQIALWQQQALVEAVTRPLNYGDPSKPREKGIDVRLAIDIVSMKMRDEYDVAVLVSDDTDLLPALEMLVEMQDASACEVATWVPKDGTHARPLRVKDSGHLIHRLTDIDYHHVHDPTDYAARRRRR